MRLLNTLISMLILSIQMQAQITIEKSDFTLEEGLREVTWNLDYSNASPPVEGEGIVWDFSDLPLDDGIYTDYLPVSSAQLPEANLKTSTTRSLLGGFATRSGETYYSYDDTGLGPVGGFYELEKFSVSALTGGTADTLTALATIEDYMERKSTIQFPLNFGDTWAYDITSNIDFQVTVAAFGLQDTPAGQETRDSAVLSVVGYGTLILPSPSGIGSVSVEVLMLKRVRKLIYHYTLGGQLAPQPMLDLFGLEQGESESYTRYYLYAKGLPRSAANIRLDKDGNIISFTISDELKNIVTSTSNVALEPIRVKAFPNPTSGSFHLAFDKPDAQDWTVELHNSFGQTVHRQAVPGGIGANQVTVTPPQLSAGLYHYVLRNHKGAVAASGGLMLK